MAPNLTCGSGSWSLTGTLWPCGSIRSVICAFLRSHTHWIHWTGTTVILMKEWMNNKRQKQMWSQINVKFEKGEVWERRRVCLCLSFVAGDLICVSVWHVNNCYALGVFKYVVNISNIQVIPKTLVNICPLTVHARLLQPPPICISKKWQR